MVFAVALGFVMAMLDVTVVNVALGDIQRDYSSLSTLVWIVDVYTLTFASLLLLGGTLADWLGAKRTYISGLANSCLPQRCAGSPRRQAFSSSPGCSSASALRSFCRVR